MKIHLSISAAFLLAASLFCGAQTYDVIDIVKASREKASSCEGPYRFDAPALTPSPKGYKPFYISHYGRHGSRTAWSATTYTHLRDYLEAARQAGAFTPRGQKLYDDFMAFYLTPYINTGDLVDQGWYEHEKIAGIMYDEFPEVFKKGGKVFARASTTQRAIVSMSAFCVSLQKKNPKLEIFGNSLHTNLAATATQNTPRELSVYYEGRLTYPGGENMAAFQARKIDYDGILGQFFTKLDFFNDKRDQTQFIMDLHDLWGGYRNYTDSRFLEDIFTPQQVADLWEVTNYSTYTGHSFNRYNHIVLLKDFEEYADKAIATGDVVADLRFGHDHVLNAFFPLLNINGAGTIPATVDDVKYWYQDYNTPMASNIQFVFYRSRKAGDDILFKVLHNGAEAALPQIQPVSGPYYKWSDFKKWCAQLYSEHPVMVPRMPQRPQGAPQGGPRPQGAPQQPRQQ